MAYQFPKDFLWGAATAALQIEGAPNADGAGKTTWQTLCEKKGAIANDDNVNIACDHFNRYKEDIQLIKKLGAKAYRFSINWSRIFPNGIGEVNSKGVDFYNRLIDELLVNGITPYATMFHWETPQYLEDKYRGWLSKETSKAFADYAGFMAGKIGDRVKDFFTVNEVVCFTYAGYGEDATFPPRIVPSPKEKYQSAHNGCLAHGLAVQSMRSVLPKDARIGIAQNPDPVVPLYNSIEHIDAARRLFRSTNAPITTLIMEGKYHEDFVKKAGADMVDYTDDELKIINSPIDFLALNIYSATIAASINGKDKIIPLQEGHPKLNMPWLNFLPETLYWTTRFAQELWNPPCMYISENGCAAIDKVDYKDEEVYDTARILYLRQSLIALHNAISEGVRIKGYFPWSLMDNFEWACGYEKRFGLTYVNFKTQERILKSSAKFYQETIKNNTIA